MKFSIQNKELFQKPVKQDDVTVGLLADFACKISEYINRLQKIKRNTETKLKIGQYRELLLVVNEINIRQERRTFIETFDASFLKLFPDFISDFNSLLMPKDQIWPKDNDSLNTNLRIFALMRLGIKDDQQIALILENSVSTIYTYKFRIKSKLIIHPNLFESKLMEIC